MLIFFILTLTRLCCIVSSSIQHANKGEESNALRKEAQVPCNGYTSDKNGVYVTCPRKMGTLL